MQQIIVDSRRKKPATLEKAHPDAVFIDVTSKGDDPWVRFSPFYPHGHIPVPFSQTITAESVEGIWQGLKVFEQQDIDLTKFTITNMRGIKRSVRRLGPVRGHRKGIDGTDLLTYRDARYQIYLPSYHWVLSHSLSNELRQIKDLSESKKIVLLDYETNTDVDDLAKPLSHASLIARFLLDDWPTIK